jgi:hypothetical protein
VVHLRIVVPSHNAEHALDLLNATPSVANLIYLERAAHKPEGDVILCDVSREAGRQEPPADQGRRRFAA